MFRAPALLMASLLAVPASAHLMVARHGTLNLTDEGAWLVLSVPVSAFPGLDADGDGRANQAELAVAKADVQDRIHDHVILADDQGPRPLEGLVVHGADHDASTSAHLLITGRFPPAPAHGPLTLSFDLFGEGQPEQAIRVREGTVARTVTFTPQASLQLASATEPAPVPPRESTKSSFVTLLPAGGWMALAALAFVGLVTGAGLRRDQTVA